MIYASETDYETYLCGRKAVITAAFSYYAMQASQIVDQFTHTNIHPEHVPDAVKFCCCELAELLYKDAAAETASGGITGESVQGWSKSYESTESRKTALKTAQRDCIYKWLADTGFLYGGVE